MWFFKDHPLWRRRARSLLLCKGKASPQHQLAPPSQKEGRQRDRERDSETDSAAKRQQGPGSGVLPTGCWGYLHYVHALLSQFVQAGQHFQSLSWEARKEKKDSKSKVCNVFPFTICSIYGITCASSHYSDICWLLQKYIFLQLFQKNIESIYPSKVK